MRKIPMSQKFTNINGVLKVTLQYCTYFESRKPLIWKFLRTYGF